MAGGRWPTLIEGQSKNSRVSPSALAGRVITASHTWLNCIAASIALCNLELVVQDALVVVCGVGELRHGLQHPATVGECLGGNAGHIDAGAADQGTLHHRHGLTASGDFTAVRSNTGTLPSHTRQPGDIR